MSEWISVKDRLPDNEDDVLVSGSSGYFIGSYSTEYSYWTSDKYEHVECTEEFEPVTHWMPLPEPPNE